MSHNKVFFSWDHAGLVLVEPLNKLAQDLGYEVINCGSFEKTPVDYPDAALKLIQAIQPEQFGVLICGSGIGMSIIANRFSHVRAALCTSEYEARTARSHNNANVICLGARVIGVEQAKACLNVFLTTSFAGGRHACRVEKIETLSEKKI